MSELKPMARTYNTSPVPLAEIPIEPVDAFRTSVIKALSGGARLVSFFGFAQRSGHRLCAVLASDRDGQLAIISTEVQSSFPSLTPECPQAERFEREILEQTGIVPVGHPRPNPVRHPDAGTAFMQVQGDEVHEVGVGPIHAGVIEPGHFRFQCHGETVLWLDVSLGYQHRGIERTLLGAPTNRTLRVMEAAAGDSTVAHAMAYCQLGEALARSQASPRGDTLRGIALELERIANHTSTLGAMAQDVGYQPTAAICSRLRGEFLNLTAQMCGSRYGRTLICPGGVRFDLSDTVREQMLTTLDTAAKDLKLAIEMLWTSPSVLARFENTGVLTALNCVDLGIVGPVARACAIDRDVRYDFASGVYRFTHVPVSTWPAGDVFARAQVYWLEIQRSIEFLRVQLGEPLPDGEIHTQRNDPTPDMLVVSMVEGWRGEVCHAAITDERGNFLVYKVVDPSFHNWIAMSLAMRNGQIADFPICNKSMNLSYCGHDL